MGHEGIALGLELITLNILRSISLPLCSTVFFLPDSIKVKNQRRTRIR